MRQNKKFDVVPKTHGGEGTPRRRFRYNAWGYNL